jgi:hypothetical protein
VAARSPIEIQPERGYLALGALRLPLAAGTDGLLCSGGARFRPVRFGERERLVCDAVVGDDARSALAALLADRSIVERGSLGDTVLTAVAVALAGGEETSRSFAQTARLAGEREGWSWERILNAPAWVVDRAAAAECAADNGWSTIVFSSAEPPDLDLLTREMSGTFLRRMVDMDCPVEAPRGSDKRIPQGVGPASPSAPRARQIIRNPADSDRTSRVGDTDLLQAAAGLPLPSSSGASSASAPQGNRARATVAILSSHRPAAISSPPAPDRPLGPTSVAPSATTAAMSEVNPTVQRQRSISPISAPDNLTRAANVALAVAPANAYEPAQWSRSETVRPEVAALPSCDRAADWMEELARALAAECDVRGLER